MHDRAPGADQSLIGARDQMLARLREHLDGDVGGNEVFFDQLAQEIEIGLRGGRESDLDLLVAHAAERLEHAQLALRPHRLDQRLVAVAQIDAAPDRRLGDDARGPSSVRQVDGLERSVLLGWVDTHLGIPLGRFRCWSIATSDRSAAGQSPKPDDRSEVAAWHPHSRRSRPTPTRARKKMSERKKITDVGENINNPLHLRPRNLGRDAPRPTLLKRRGGKSQGKGEAVHKSDPTGATAEGQAQGSDRSQSNSPPEG